MQIADGPWNLRSAVQFAHETLARATATAETRSDAMFAAAKAWNGEAVRQPGSKYAYVDVLDDAYDIAVRAITLAKG